MWKNTCCGLTMTHFPAAIENHVWKAHTTRIKQYIIVLQEQSSVGEGEVFTAQSSANNCRWMFTSVIGDEYK